MSTRALRELRDYLNAWQTGTITKSEIDIELGRPQSHGKYITRLWRDQLGVETENEHPLVTENRRLKSLLEEYEIEY